MGNTESTSNQPQSSVVRSQEICRVSSVLLLQKIDSELQSRIEAAARKNNSEHQKNVATKGKCYDPQDKTLTLVGPEERDDTDYLCNEYQTLRAKLSCGHTCTPMSLTDYGRYLLDDGKSRFVCGQTGCDREWPYKEVCKLALLTQEEMTEFEMKLFNNARKYLQVKVCPGCKSYAARRDPHDLSVKCAECTAEKNRTFMFCWQCLKEWKGPVPRSDCCENDGCMNPLVILRKCEDIEFVSVRGVTGCPSIRACPTCGLLVEHDKTKCKNTVCSDCKVEFCFVCLKLTKECQKINPYSYFTVCSTGVAPRQTSIPVQQRLY